jgi:Uma2 family endonuclease
MAQAAVRLLTVQDFMDIPEGPPYYQLIEGDLFMMPPPGAFHQDIAGNIFSLIREYLRKNAVGKVAIAPYGVFLNDVNAFLPDVFFVSKAKLKQFSKRGFEGAPDLVVEVLSPGTARFDKTSKKTVYARSGVLEYWLVDPSAEEVQIFYLAEDSDDPKFVYGRKNQFTSPLVPGLQFRGEEIFA